MPDGNECETDVNKTEKGTERFIYYEKRMKLFDCVQSANAYYPQKITEKTH